MNNSIAEQLDKIRWTESQLQRADLSWKRRKDLTKYKHRLKKELKICEGYINHGK